LSGSLLADAPPRMKIAALSVLLRLGEHTPQLSKEVTALLSDPDREVRSAAARVLSRRDAGARELPATLVTYLVQRRSHDTRLRGERGD
jgi:oligoendopeptidase F